MTDSVEVAPRRDSPDPNLIQSGDVIENLEYTNPGFYETVDKPRTCPCCFLDHYYANGFGMVLGRHGFEVHVCAYADHWIGDELGRQACPDHLKEKIKDGLFGSLPGAFKTPAGMVVEKKSAIGAVAPLVTSTKKRGKR